MWHEIQISYLNTYFQYAIPLPAFEITARESPTFATYRWSPTKTAVEAVEPSSLKALDSDSKKSVSVFWYVSPVFRHKFQVICSSNKNGNRKSLKWSLMRKKEVLIASFVSVKNSGCFRRFSNKCSFKYSAARDPPWPNAPDIERKTW